MREIREIVVGVDLLWDGGPSPGSALAIQQARWLARHTGSRITLIHSSAEDEAWSAEANGYGPSPSGVDAESTLQSMADEITAGGVAVESRVVPETAWLAITRHVLRSGADLVVAGKRARATDGGPLIGSVTAKLLRKCPTSVWVVKPHEDAGIRSVLAATDLTRVGTRVVEQAAYVATAAQAELHIVHALHRPLAIQLEGDSATERFIEDNRKRAELEIRAVLRGSPLEATAKLHIGVTSPTRAVIEGCEHLRPDLVVMGTISRGGLPGVLVGNTAERLLPRLDVSLLTVKPHDFVCPVSLAS